METQVKSATDKVELVCNGIVSPMGFNVYPEEGTAAYVEFVPGKGTVVDRAVADYLEKVAPGKFKVVEAAPAEAQAEKTAEKGDASHGQDHRKKRKN